MWPTDHAPTEDRAAPEPKARIDGLARVAHSAAVSATGPVALALDDGKVVLRRLDGDAPLLEPHAGTGPSAVTFTPSGRHLVALRAGRVFAWSLPERPTPAVPAPAPR